jgi:hypothetical protein
MPSQNIALEPERKVGSTAVAQAFRRGGHAHSYLTGSDPDLKFRVEGFQFRVEQCRRSQRHFFVSWEPSQRFIFRVADQIAGLTLRVHA